MARNDATLEGPTRAAAVGSGNKSRFRRALPAERRSALIAATAECLATRGAAATSVREVAARAGVSPGLIRHYFGGMLALIAETYETVGRQVQADIERALDQVPESPEAKLRALVAANFCPPILDPKLLATWLAFWSLVGSEEPIRVIHQRIYAGYRARLEHLIAETAALRGLAIDPGREALALTALLDGLWLELCLDPTTFPPNEAVRIGLEWIDRLLAD